MYHTVSYVAAEGKAGSSEKSLRVAVLGNVISDRLPPVFICPLEQKEDMFHICSLGIISW